MKNKKTLSIVSIVTGLCLVLAIALAVVFWGNKPNNENRYNPNPDVSSKVVGSNNGFMTRIMPVILDDVLFNATCVIIGEVVDDGILESSLQENSGGISHTIAKIRVIDTISGIAPSRDIISYRQIGRPGSDMLQTKVKKGEACVFVLQYFHDLDQYLATSFEESVFYLDENNMLVSMSDQLFCAKYDGINILTLSEDVQEIQCSEAFRKLQKAMN